jgi:hypothetical protein
VGLLFLLGHTGPFISLSLPLSFLSLIYHAIDYGERETGEQRDEGGYERGL